MLASDACFELLLHDRLERAVDRQVDVVAAHRRHVEPAHLIDPSLLARVPQDLAISVPPRQEIAETFLDALDTHPVGVGGADNVAGKQVAWIAPPGAGLDTEPL